MADALERLLNSPPMLRPFVGVPGSGYFPERKLNLPRRDTPLSYAQISTYWHEMAQKHKEGFPSRFRPEAGLIRQEFIALLGDAHKAGLFDEANATVKRVAENRSLNLEETLDQISRINVGGFEKRMETVFTRHPEFTGILDSYLNWIKSTVEVKGQRPGHDRDMALKRLEENSAKSIWGVPWTGYEEVEKALQEKQTAVSVLEKEPREKQIYDVLLEAVEDPATPGHVIRSLLKIVDKSLSDEQRETLLVAAEKGMAILPPDFFKLPEGKNEVWEARRLLLATCNRKRQARSFNDLVDNHSLSQLNHESFSTLLKLKGVKEALVLDYHLLCENGSSREKRMMFSAIRDKETYNAYFQSLVDWLVEVQGLNFQEATAALAIARELNFVAGVAEQASVLKGRFLEKTEESRTHNPLVSRLADPEGWAGHLLDKLGKWERYGLGRVKNSHAFSQVEVNFAGGRKRFSYWLAANWKSDQNKIEPTPFEFPKIQPESVFARYQNRIEVASQEFKKVFTGAE